VLLSTNIEQLRNLYRVSKRGA